VAFDVRLPWWLADNLRRLADGESLDTTADEPSVALQVLNIFTWIRLFA
jgi:hypothetical protein